MRPVTVVSRAPDGLESPEVRIEVFAGPGLPGLNVVGLVETAIKESKDRVRAAILNSGFEMPDRRIVVNLAPADLPKGGSHYDLAIALGILSASRQVPARSLEGIEFVGELSLNGELRATTGVLPLAIAATRTRHRIVVANSSLKDVAILDDQQVMVANRLTEVVEYLRGDSTLATAELTTSFPTDAVAATSPDMADVQGQSKARRALEIAAVGGHHLLMSGPPGTGKSMLAQRLPGILPPPEQSELLQIAALQSLRPDVAVDISRRPFRAPHHSASAAALAGGGSNPRPGEISLAHQGVLFLDELPEFSRDALEILREPLETGCVTVARARHTRRFPAAFQLIAAMNPCPCGYAGDSQQACRCTPEQARRYRDKLSGPLLDRLDLLVEVVREPVKLGDPGPRVEDSTAVQARVTTAARAARRRGHGPNATLTDAAIKQHCWPEKPGVQLLETAAQRFGLSRRACNRVLRVARSIADLAAEDVVHKTHIAEALSLRSESLLNPVR